MPLFAADIVPDIPDRFWKIPYDIAHDLLGYADGN
jgi:hypothetical protein